MTAPRMPKFTCPAIDRVKSAISSAEQTATDGRSSDNPDELDRALREVEKALSGAAGELEDLRTANSALRDCAEYWKAEAERLESLVDELQRVSSE